MKCKQALKLLLENSVDFDNSIPRALPQKTAFKVRITS